MELLKKRNESIGIFFSFPKGFYWVKRGGPDNSTPFQRIFLGRIGKGEFSRDGDYFKGSFLGGMGGKRLVVFSKYEGEDFFCFSRNFIKSNIIFLGMEKFQHNFF